MATMMKVMTVFLVVVMAISSLAPPETAEAAMSCGAVASKLAGCMPYLKGGPGPSPACCGGVKALNGMAKSPADRQGACNCLKKAASSGINLSNAASLPGKCGVNVGYAISPSIDCSRVH